MKKTQEEREARMTLVEHLAELRNRIVKVVVAVGVGAVLAWFLYPQIFDVLVDPYCDTVLADVADARTVEGDRVGDGSGLADVAEECVLVQIDPLEGFTIRIKVATYGGIALAMPVILWQIWRFVTPGLYDHEKKYAIPFVISALVLFFLGAGLAYYTLPKALEFLTDVGGSQLQTAFRPGAYFQLVTYMMLAFGAGFEFPILLIFLQMAGIIQPKMLASGRRYAIVGIVVLVAVITPSGDPYSLAILSVPMYLFYELSILAGKLVNRRNSKRQAEEAAAGR